MAIAAMEFGAPTIPGTDRAVRGAEAASRRRTRSEAARGMRSAWAWLTGTAYRPERHYMRGGPVASGTPLRGSRAGQSVPGAGRRSRP
jgi:hypothetical protein